LNFSINTLLPVMGNKQKRKVQREREERERVEAAQLRRKRWIAVGGGMVLLGLVGFAAVRWLLEPVPTIVQGRLAGVREISFREGEQSGGGISPVCGCAHPHLHAWRGIEFSGRRVTLRHTGSLWTDWAISSAEPDAVSLTGGIKVARATAYRLNPKGRFDPFSLVNGDRNGNAAAVDREISVNAETFSIVTHSTLRIGLSGAVPVGAWVPFPGSWVNLTASRSPFPEVARRPRLIEHYPSRVGFWPNHNGTPHPRERQVYPLGDFLGPNLVLWTDDPQARIVGTPFGRPAGRGIITAVVVSSSVFSTRIGAAPASPYQVASMEHLSLAEPESLAEDIADGSGTTGTVSVTVDQPLSEGDYRSVRRRVRLKPKSWIAVPPHPEFEGELAQAGFWEEEHYPPLPAQTGFNVFGPLTRIELHEVYGNLTVGDKNVDLRGSGDVQLNEVQAFRNPSDEQLISAPLATSGKAASLRFEARGTVSVNEIAQATTQSRWEMPLRALALVISLLGGAIGLLNGIRRHREAAL
jgi:hypothetical protein